MMPKQSFTLILIGVVVLTTLGHAQIFDATLVSVIDTSEKDSVLHFINAFYQCPEAKQIDQYLFLPSIIGPDIPVAMSDVLIWKYGDDCSIVEDWRRNRAVNFYRDDPVKFYSLFGRSYAAEKFYNTFHGWFDEQVDSFIKQTGFQSPRRRFRIEYANKNRYRAVRDSDISADEYFFRDTNRIEGLKRWLYNAYRLPWASVDKYKINRFDNTIVCPMLIRGKTYQIPTARLYLSNYMCYEIMKYDGGHKLIGFH